MPLAPAGGPTEKFVQQGNRRAEQYYLRPLFALRYLRFF